MVGRVPKTGTGLCDVLVPLRLEGELLDQELEPEANGLDDDENQF